MKIGIDMGHCLSGFDLGARGSGLKEEILTREVGKRIISKLESLGHTVINCSKDTSYSVNESLSYRVKKANDNAVELFISIHFNAGGGSGTEIYTYGGEKHLEAQNILKNMTELGFKNRGIKDGSWIYVIRKTNSKAMLIEICFMDNTKDMGICKWQGYDKIAEAIVTALRLENLNQRDTSLNKIVNNKDNIIKRLQHELNIRFNAGLVEDGILGPKTLGALVNVKEGYKGEIVKIIQELLIKKGYFLGAMGADGIFGQNTKKAVMEYQNKNSLMLDGIVGINTWKSLLS